MEKLNKSNLNSRVVQYTRDTPAGSTTQFAETNNPPGRIDPSNIGNMAAPNESQNLQQINDVAGGNVSKPLSKTTPEEIHLAARTGDTETLKRSHEDHGTAIFTMQDKNGDTCVHAAAASGQVECLKFLYSTNFGDSIFGIANDLGEFAGHVAAKNGQLLPLKYIYKIIGNDLFGPDNDANTPVHLAARYKHIDCVAFMCTAIEDALSGSTDDDGITLLELLRSTNIHDQTPIDLARGPCKKFLTEKIEPKNFIKVSALLAWVKEAQHLLHKVIHHAIATQLMRKSINMQACVLPRLAKDEDNLEFLTGVVGKVILMGGIYGGDIELYLASQKAAYNSQTALTNSEVEAAIPKAIIHAAYSQKHSIETLSLMQTVWGEKMLHKIIDKGDSVFGKIADKTGQTVLHIEALTINPLLGGKPLKNIHAVFGDTIFTILNDAGETIAYSAAGNNNVEYLRFFHSKIGGDIFTQPTKRGDTAAHIAAANGHLESLQYMHTVLGHRIFEIKDVLGRTITHYSTEANRRACLKFIFSKAGHNAFFTADKHGFTPAHIAAMKGKLAALKMLITKIGLDAINTRDNQGNTPADYAEQGGHTDCLALLRPNVKKNSTDSPNTIVDSPNTNITKHTEQGIIIQTITSDSASPSSNWTQLEADLNAYTEITKDIDNQNKNFTVAHITAGQGNIDVLKHLYSEGVNFNQSAHNGFTAAHVAAYYGKLESLEYLTSIDIDLNAATADDITPAYLAIQNGHSDCLRFLFQNGVDLKQSRGHNTLVDVAIGFNQPHCIKVLFDAGLDLTVHVYPQPAPVVCAIHCGHNECAQMIVNLLFSGTPPAETQQMLSSTAISASRNVNPAPDWESIVTQLNKPDLQQMTADLSEYIEITTAPRNQFARYTPAHIAAASGNIGVLNALDRAGVDFNQTASDGWSAVHVAAYYGRLESLEFLALAGADLNQPALDGTTPAYLAIQNGHSDSSRFLFASGVYPLQAFGDYTLIDLAVECNQPSSLQVLFDAEVDLSFHFNSQPAPIVSAITRGHFECVQLMLNLLLLSKQPTSSTEPTRF